MSEPPLEECLDRFWFAGPEPQEASARARPDTAKTPLERLGRPQITVQGRNLADLLQPVYDTLREGSAEA